MGEQRDEVSGSLRPARAERRVAEDEGARCVVELLAELVRRVPHEPAVTPPAGGMARLGNLDRASYVWFLPCPEDGVYGRDGRPAACNHGIGVDRSYGKYEVRAWAHGSPKIHSLSIHTHHVTAELLETAAKLVGIPLRPIPDLCGHGNVQQECENWVSDPDGCWPERSK